MSSHLVPFLNSITMKGDATMETKINNPEWVDYVVAHPFCIPLWAAVFGWMVETFSVGWFWVIPLFCFAFWFYSYLDSASCLFAYYAAQEPQPAPSALLAEVKP